MKIIYHLVDVFSKKPFSGNGLSIFSDANKLDKKMMQRLTQEMRQFESIFYHQKNDGNFRAYIFTMEEELDFAGHPLFGLSALIHSQTNNNSKANEIKVQLNKKVVHVKTIYNNGFYTATMNQGLPKFIHSLNESEELEFLVYLSLNQNDKYNSLNLEVVSTGLPYLIIPIRAASISKIKVTIPDLEKKLSEIGAKFFYVLDIENNKGRTFDNKGLVEDIATGSAAGPVGAYLIKNGFEKFNSLITIYQGEHLNRPSEIRVYVNGKEFSYGDILVEGDVVLMANGMVNLP